MSTISVRSCDRRKSADGRLQTPLPLEGTRKKVRRVKSALETKREHESSTDIFPDVERNNADPTWGTSQYTLDYGPKKPEAPVLVRPVSPTRKHNPQPSKAFLIWKHPVRIHKHKKAVPPAPNAWRFIHEGFYDDYTDEYNTGDAKNEVPVTNLAKIEFPGKPKNGYTSTPHLLSGITGTRAHLNSRGSKQKSDTIRPPTPQSRMIHNTLRGNTLPVLKQWLKGASHKERDVVLHMLKAADDDSEESRLQKAVSDMLQPDSAERVQGWLKNANSEERDIVLHVLETLTLAADDNVYQMNADETYAYQKRFGKRHSRSQSYPISLRQHKTYHEPSCHHSSSGQYSRHLYPQGHLQPLSARGKQSSSLKETNMSIGLVGKKIGGKLREETPELWHHRIKKRTTGASRIYGGSVWHMPNKDMGQHYSINPEWPIA